MTKYESREGLIDQLTVQNPSALLKRIESGLELNVIGIGVAEKKFTKEGKETLAECLILECVEGIYYTYSKAMLINYKKYQYHLGRIKITTEIAGNGFPKFTFVFN